MKENEPDQARNKAERGSSRNPSPPADILQGKSDEPLDLGRMPEPFKRAPRCSATSKRSGMKCRAPAMRGRSTCYVHGGKSTGPRSKTGLERSRFSRWKHGRYSQEEVQRRRLMKKIRRQLKQPGWKWREEDIQDFLTDLDRWAEFQTPQERATNSTAWAAARRIREERNKRIESIKNGSGELAG